MYKLTFKYTYCKINFRFYLFPIPLFSMEITGKLTVGHKETHRIAEIDTQNCRYTNTHNDRPTNPDVKFCYIDL